MSIFDDATPQWGFPKIAALPWHTDTDAALRRAHSMLVTEHGIAERLASWLSGLERGDVDFIVERSPERSTHYKWRLGGDRRDYLVWLHQYKKPEVFAKASTFAASIHNHRMAFTSRVMSGALHVTWYEVGDPEDPGGLNVLENRRLGRDTTVSLSPDEIHEITRVEEDTFTFVIQAPPVRHASTVYRNGRTVSAPDLDDLLPGVITALRRMG